MNLPNLYNAKNFLKCALIFQFNELILTTQFSVGTSTRRSYYICIASVLTNCFSKLHNSSSFPILFIAVKLVYKHNARSSFTGRYYKRKSVLIQEIK